MDDLVADIEQVRFPVVRLTGGYARDQVDRFLAELVEHLRRGEPVAERIADARFTPVRLRQGYAMDEVDDFLADIVSRSERG